MISSQGSQVEETCPVHHELLVAYNKNSNQLVCNKCIYELSDDNEDVLKHLTFTSFVASCLKEQFDEKFNHYKDTYSKMGQVAPGSIKSTLETTVSQFFSSVAKQIDAVQEQVLQRINDSKNLKELEQLLENSKTGFALELDRKFEQGK